MSMTSQPKNLETDFDNMCITPETESRMRSRSLSDSISKCSKIINSRRRKSLAPPSRISCKKQSSSVDDLVIRPSKLNLSSVMKKPSVIRPAKLKIKNPKLFLLKPATLTVKEEKRKTLKNSKFTSLPSQSTAASFSSDRVFSNDKLNSHTSFKSLISNEDIEISKAFDTLSFKKLRQLKTVPGETLTANKRENTSTCSVQARMESTIPVDCDETSIEELASYFDLFVHIPKKMSSMAEMMYI